MAAAVLPTAMHIHPLVIPQQTGWEVPCKVGLPRLHPGVLPAGEATKESPLLG